MTALLPIAALLALAGDARPRPPAQFAPERFRAHVAYLASDELAGRAVGSAGSARAIAYLVQHLRAAGAKGLGGRSSSLDGSVGPASRRSGGEQDRRDAGPTRPAKGLGAGDGFLQDFPFPSRPGVSARNVLAVVPGKGPLAREAVLVSAHHDHLGTDPALARAGKDAIYNGADDNASGCAALLLVAAALHADRARLPTSHRTVIFASFDAEEHGLLGSRHYVNHPPWPLAQTAANLNFDMVGRLHGARLLALDGQSSPFLAGRLAELAPRCGLRVETRLNGAGRSDHLSFLDRSIPALQFCSGMHPDYHQVSDEVGKIDADGGARVAWLAYRLLRDALERPGRLRYQRPPAAFDVAGLLRLAFRLGIVPEQNAQSGRTALVRFVVPGSLAARRGLHSGDEITGINGQTFRDMADVAVAFSRIRPGRDVRLAVRRAGQAVEVTIPAAELKDFAGPAVRPIGGARFEVLFRYRPTGKAKTVSLAGSFNGWNVKAQPLDGPDKEGFYAARLVLTRGTYEYKFVIDGQKWVGDPTNLRTAGPQGNSLLQVGEEP